MICLKLFKVHHTA